jgi:hypothetical protein
VNPQRAIRTGGPAKSRVARMFGVVEAMCKAFGSSTRDVLPQAHLH